MSDSGSRGATEMWSSPSGIARTRDASNCGTSSSSLFATSWLIVVMPSTLRATARWRWR